MDAGKEDINSGTMKMAKQSTNPYIQRPTKDAEKNSMLKKTQ